MGEISFNQLHNMGNHAQTNRTKILCVCSAGLLRSPTAAFILSNEPFNFNTRAVGTEDYALFMLSEACILWADVFVVMDERQEQAVHKIGELMLASEIFEPWHSHIRNKPCHLIHVPDRYKCRSKELIASMEPKLRVVFPDEDCYSEH